MKDETPRKNNPYQENAMSKTNVSKKVQMVRRLARRKLRRGAKAGCVPCLGSPRAVG